MAEAFAVHIQREKLANIDSSKYGDVLAEYLEGARIDGGTAGAQSTLSNCTTRETECTCDRDD